MKKETIDLTPTWRESVMILITVLEHGSPEGKIKAKKELLRIGMILDQVIQENQLTNNKN